MEGRSVPTENPVGTLPDSDPDRLRDGKGQTALAHGA
jgi:hypothetical protein